MAFSLICNILVYVEIAVEKKYSLALIHLALYDEKPESN